jgi:Fe-S oxidoreductase
MRRVFDVCAGCRRCLPLCPSFKVLFDRIDVEAVDGDVDKLPKTDLKEVVDLCYQCKLCYNHCPYTPPHRWAIDFPRLMLRARAAEARQHGVTVQDRMLGNADLVGKVGSLTAPLSNWMNELAVHRAFMQAVTGIHKDRRLPKFHRPTFSSWFKSTAKPAAAEGGRTASRKVALFSTCTVEYNAPAVGRAAVRVLERNGVDVSVPVQRCCGMPYLDGGAVDQCKALIRDNVRTLAEAVREGREIVSPGPTCSYMLKQEYPWLDRSEDKSADVLRAIPGTTVDVVEKCSAVDGTWGFKTQYFELSMKVARPLFDAVRTGGAAAVATDCPLAALQISQGTGTEPRHPIQLLAHAYGFDES